MTDAALKISLAAGERLQKAIKAQSAFHKGKNRKADPYQLALEVQISKRLRDVAAQELRAGFRIIDGGQK